MDFISMLPVICVILVVVILISAHRKKKRARTSAPTPTPTPTPSKLPVSAEQPQVIVIKPVIIYEDTPRNVRICPWCDGENDLRVTRCRICAGKLGR